MAKSSKKPEQTEKKAPAKSSASSAKASAKPQATAATAKKAPAQGKTAMGSSPLIDTSFVASSAARMLVAGVGGKNVKPAPQSNKPESSLFKQLKSGLNKPHSATMDSLLDKTHGPGTQKTQGFAK